MALDSEDGQTGQLNVWQRGGLFAGPVLALAVLFFADLVPGKPIPTRAAAVAVLMAIWWITDALPLAVTALLPMVLFPVLGILSGKDTAAEYFNDTIFLFMGGFLVAMAMERWDLHKRLALRILVTCGPRPQMILFSFLSATCLISMWISNTAAAMMMMPIALAILLHLESVAGKEAMKKFGAGVMLAVGYGASIGGLATLVGTPPNLVFKRIYDQQFPDNPISFAQWFAFGLPFMILFMLIAWGWLAFLFPADARAFKSAGRVIDEEFAKLGPWRREEKILLVLFVALAMLWLFREPISVGSLVVPGWSTIRLSETQTLFPNPKFISDGVVAVAIALLLFIIPGKPSADASATRILEGGAVLTLPWNIVLLFGGGFALAKGIETSGLSDWLATQFAGMKGMSPFVIVLLSALIIAFLTELTSNTATATILMPILAANAKALDLAPWMLMVPGVVACSYGFMLPVGTPPNAIVYGTGRVRMADMFKAGLFLDVVGAVLVSIAIFVIGPWAFGK
ncbi:SLC13 family permease [soil metagenome]